MSSNQKYIYTAGLQKCNHGGLLCNCKKSTCIEDETYYRNKVIVQNHGKLPSYCIWTDYDVRSQSTIQRLNWWENVAASHLLKSSK